MIRLFRVFIPTSVIGLLISEMLLASACFVLAYWISGPEEMSVYFLLEDGIARTAIVVGTIIYLALGFVFHPVVIGVPAFGTPALGH